ncbi:hypothetical protein ARMGADRAFT_1026730 [Armillaria gallica]|uniref:Uncharacterized protein n=1 Tax=Armillaria gallica TaxID=47427 RepID=A0A2H3DXR7_ARMGA|nr:hypothetical protein ARMGADRAFT_1026730 [Armillaria gallica]
MATQTDIPSELTNDDKALVFQILDTWLNSEILYALLYGIYTGILAVTLWNISTWVFSIAAAISTILADLYMIWCCWMVWGQHWLVVLLPIFSLVSAIISRAMTVYYNKVNPASPLWNIFEMLYISLNLVTTLSCTLLIIYRIVAVTGIRHGAMGRLGVYRYFIQVLMESSALYSISVILYLAFIIHDPSDPASYYFDAIASIAKGVAPTLLIGRAAAGHTCPRDDSDESTLSSLHFQTPSTTSSQHEESTIQSSVFAVDIEAQPEHS